jgi:hypothetical protein
MLFLKKAIKDFEILFVYIIKALFQALLIKIDL